MSHLKIGNIYINPFNSNLGIDYNNLNRTKELLLSNFSRNICLIKKQIQRNHKCIPPKKCIVQKTNKVIPNEIEKVNETQHLIKKDDLKKIKVEFKEFIKKNEIEVLFQHLGNKITSDSELYNKLVLIQARYNRTIEENLNGLICKNDFEVELNKINNSIMHVIDSLKKDDLNETSN